MTKAINPKILEELPGKPEGKLRSNGSIMSDDRDNIVWYLDSTGQEYEHHVKPDRWFRCKD